jgi:hypothetical protein
MYVPRLVPVCRNHCLCTTSPGPLQLAKTRIVTARQKPEKRSHQNSTMKREDNAQGLVQKPIVAVRKYTCCRKFRDLFPDSGGIQYCSKIIENGSLRAANRRELGQARVLGVLGAVGVRAILQIILQGPGPAGCCHKVLKRALRLLGVMPIRRFAYRAFYYWEC